LGAPYEHDGVKEEYVLMTTSFKKALQTIGNIRSLEPDANDGIVEAVISTGDIARDNAIIRVEGWEFDNFWKNPVVCWSHDTWSVPIGKALEIKAEGDELSAITQLDMADPWAAFIYGKIQRGFINATSVQWNPFEAEFQEIDGRDVLVFLRQELLEYSFCSVPADPGCLVLRGMPGRTIGEPLDVAGYKQPARKARVFLPPHVRPADDVLDTLRAQIDEECDAACQAAKAAGAPAEETATLPEGGKAGDDGDDMENKPRLENSDCCQDECCVAEGSDETCSECDMEHAGDEEQGGDEETNEDEEHIATLVTLADSLESQAAALRTSIATLRGDEIDDEQPAGNDEAAGQPDKPDLSREHVCVRRDAGDFDPETFERTRLVARAGGRPYFRISGTLINGKLAVQSLRYDSSLWSAVEAKAHAGEGTFYRAKAEADAVITASLEDLASALQTRISEEEAEGRLDAVRAETARAAIAALGEAPPPSGTAGDEVDEALTARIAAAIERLQKPADVMATVVRVVARTTGRSEDDVRSQMNEDGD
jgi:HK97 family phage prohead protease